MNIENRHADLDDGALYARVEEALPTYARPAFLRLLEAPDLTGTFKIRKVGLQREGFDPKTITDTLLYRDDARRRYLPRLPEIADRIRSGELRF
ncbi:MAG: hypothetical protein GY937_00875 [bacterium]|nr:hypothetical protein [bacterium]